jgi:large subunit ribosomal protein L21
MYVVFATGGKQYRVSQGDVIQVEKIDAEEGEEISFNDILMFADGKKVSIGAPYLKKGKITAKIKKHARYKKIEVIKFKRRKQYHKQMGHRQWYTEIEISNIEA